jgi:hypothetical protein
MSDKELYDYLESHVENLNDEEFDLIIIENLTNNEDSNGTE